MSKRNLCFNFTVAGGGANPVVSLKRGERSAAGMHLMVGFRGVTFEEELKALIADFEIGGIVLFKRNIQNPKQLRSLIDEAQRFSRAALGRPLLVSIDQEGGPVQRLVPPSFTRLPSARELAEQGANSVAEWAARTATELRSMGIHINLAPVLDVVGNGASNFMEERSLGSDPERVARFGEVWVGALQVNGVSATAKHFPGLGRAELDPHHFAPVIRWQDDQAMQADLVPFAKAIGAGVHCVMTSHALYPYLDPDWPATLSPKINDEWLRKKLSFGGVLLSDDLDMAAVSQKYDWKDMAGQGLLASIDFFLLCQRTENIAPFFEALCSAIESDPALSDAHQKSVARIDRLLNIHR